MACSKLFHTQLATQPSHTLLTNFALPWRVCSSVFWSMQDPPINPYGLILYSPDCCCSCLISLLPPGVLIRAQFPAVWLISGWLSLLLFTSQLGPDANFLYTQADFCGKRESRRLITKKKKSRRTVVWWQEAPFWFRFSQCAAWHPQVSLCHCLSLCETLNTLNYNRT